MAKSSLRLTFTQRILFALVAVVVSALFVGSYILLSVRRLEVLASEEVRTHDAASAARALETQSLRYGNALRRYVNLREPSALLEMQGPVLASQATRAKLLELTRLEAIRSAVARYSALSEARMAAADSIVAMISAGNTDGLTAALGRHNQSELQVHDVLEEIIEIERVESARTLAARLRSQRVFERNVMLAIGLAVFVITTLLYSVVLGGVTRRLRQLTEMARRVAAGDYSVGREVSDAQDELSVLVRAFDEMAGQLAQFDKVKEEFVALAAHQLRTPATGVKGNLGMLIEGYFGSFTPEQMEILRDADACNERQLALINDLLVVARTDSGRLELARSRGDLGVLLDQVVSDHKPAAKTRRHTLTLERPGQPVVLDMDEQKIRIVIDNLVDNAIKYTPDGGRISVKLEGDSNGTATVAVTDSGVGIPEEDHGKMFRKFGRVPNPMSEQVGGTGLGLYLANEIVKLHGGTVRLASTAGSGSTFIVTLPKEPPA